MAVKDFDTLQEGMLKMFESLSADHPEWAADFIAKFPPEQRLRGLTPEELERLKRLLH
jgi:hypothetical protein